MRCFLDSNVFLYAMGADHPEKEPCLKLLDLAVSGALETVTSSEVLQEVLYVRLRRGDRSDAVAAVRWISDIVDSVLPVTGPDVDEACDLLSHYPTLDARDAVHAAVAKRNGISEIVSADKAFGKIKGLHRLTAIEAAKGNSQ